MLLAVSGAHFMYGFVLSLVKRINKRRERGRGEKMRWKEMYGIYNRQERSKKGLLKCSAEKSLDSPINLNEELNN